MLLSFLIRSIQAAAVAAPYVISGLFLVCAVRLLAQPEQVHEVPDDAERELYLSPGGIYTEADIVANGGQTASQRFTGFRSAHETNPAPGSLICPVTQTKAKPQCVWVIHDQTYQFCSPPCIDEFVRLAKETPDAIKEPGEYVK